jgi:hypothetical protein
VGELPAQQRCPPGAFCPTLPGVPAPRQVLTMADAVCQPIGEQRRALAPNVFAQRPVLRLDLENLFHAQL